MLKMGRQAQFKVDFSGKYLASSCTLAGAALFLRVVYFSLIKPISVCSGWMLTVAFWLPLLAEIAWIFLMRVMKPHTTDFYGVFAAILCVLMILQCYYFGSILLALLLTLFYLLSGVVLLAVCYGWLPYRRLAVMALCVAAVVDLLAGLRGKNILAFSTVCSTVAMAVFAGGLKKK